MSYDDEFEQPGEVQQTDAPDITTLAVLNQSEINQQIATARHYPRSIKRFRDEALQLATLDEQTAAECIYALPRGGKTIEGPSARFAEIINYSWGNTRAGARVVGEDEEFVTSQGLFYDLEKNTAISYEVKRRITDSQGRRYNADMIGVTSNAASSIGLRNAILKGIPKALWKPIYEAARKVVAGDIRTLANRREEAIKAFAIYGVTKEMIFATIGVKGVEDITIDHLVTLKGMLTAIQEGDTTPEQAFGAASTEDRNLASKSGSRLKDAMANAQAAQQAVSPKSSPGPQAASEPGSAAEPRGITEDDRKQAEIAAEKIRQQRSGTKDMQPAVKPGTVVEDAISKGLTSPRLTFE